MRVMLLACVLGTVALPAAAQRPHTREGFWIGFGIGYGSAGISCDDCGSTQRRSSFTSFLRMGGTLNSRVLLGGDVTGWTKTVEGQTSTIGNVTFTVLYYPQPASGFHVRGGVGFSAYWDRDSGSSLSAEGAGVGVIAGVGYDLRVGRNLSLTALADYLMGSVGDIEAGGSTVATGWNQNMFHVALGVTFH